jgi:hypothetical protein
MPQRIASFSEAPVVEYLDGERRRKVIPRSKHARVQWLVGMLLERCGGEIGMTGTEWDFRIGLVDDSESFLVPDVAFITFERLKAIEKKERDRPPVAPRVQSTVCAPLLWRIDSFIPLCRGLRLTWPKRLRGWSCSTRVAGKRSFDCAQDDKFLPFSSVPLQNKKAPFRRLFPSGWVGGYSGMRRCSPG